MNDHSLDPDPDELDVAISDSLKRSFQPPPFGAGSVSWSSQTAVGTAASLRPFLVALLAAGLGMSGLILYSSTNSSTTSHTDSSNPAGPLNVSPDGCETEIRVDLSDQLEFE